MPGVTAIQDQVISFSVGAGAVRGRIARLGPALDFFLSGTQPYPKAVGHLLAETAVLATVLAASLKYNGIFSLQAQGKGPITLLVVDITSEGHLRAHARYDADKISKIGVRAHGSVKQLLGKGYLAFTVDQGADTERYQGIVELTGDSLEECAKTYFKQSEQLDTAVEVAVSAPTDSHGWIATAVMIQRMPTDSANAPIMMAEDAQEGWHRAGILLGSVKPSEMLDPALSPQQLLYRLYHAEHLQIFDPKAMEARCRCSRERVKATLDSLPAEDLGSLADAEGRITVTCEFCHTEHAIPLSELTPQ